MKHLLIIADHHATTTCGLPVCCFYPNSETGLVAEGIRGQRIECSTASLQADCPLCRQVLQQKSDIKITSNANTHARNGGGRA